MARFVPVKRVSGADDLATLTDQAVYVAESDAPGPSGRRSSWPYCVVRPPASRIRLMSSSVFFGSA
jgi:hypothetical protein